MSIIKILTKTGDYYHLLIFRIVVGIVFFVHGAQKLFSWFNGWGLEELAIGWGPLVYIQVITWQCLLGQLNFWSVFLIIGLMTD